jgi:hypothetical protein
MLASKFGTVVTRGMFDGRYIGDNVINLPQTSVVNLSHKAMEAGITAAADNKNIAQAMVTSGFGSAVNCVATSGGVIFNAEESIKKANFAINAGDAVVKEMVANGSNNIGQAVGKQVAESTGTWAGAKVVQVISSLNSREADNVKSKPAEILATLEQQAARDESFNQIDDRYNNRTSRKQRFSYNSNHPAFDELPRTYNYRNADFDPNYWEHEDYLPAEQQNNAPGLDAEFTNVAFNQHLRGMQSWSTDSFNSYEGLPHIYSHAYMDTNINASRKIFSSAQPFGFSNLRYNGNNIATNSGISFDILSEFSSSSWHGFKDNIWYDLANSVADSIALPCKILSLPGIFIDHHELNYPWSDFSDNERQYIHESYADAVNTYDNTKKFIIAQANFLAPRNITDSLLFSSLPTYILYRYSEPVIKYMPAAMNEIKSDPSGAGYLFGSGFSKVASAFVAPGAIGAGYKVINVSTKALAYASTKGAPILFGGMKKIGGLTKNAFKKYSSKQVTSNVFNPRVQRLANIIEDFLGKDFRMIKNADGDAIFINTNNTRKIRFDINDPHGYLPHGHVEVYDHKLKDWIDFTEKHIIYLSDKVRLTPKPKN